MRELAVASLRGTPHFMWNLQTAGAKNAFYQLEASFRRICARGFRSLSRRPQRGKFGCHKKMGNFLTTTKKMWLILLPLKLNAAEVFGLGCAEALETPVDLDEGGAGGLVGGVWFDSTNACIGLYYCKYWKQCCVKLCELVCIGACTGLYLSVNWTALECIRTVLVNVLASVLALIENTGCIGSVFCTYHYLHLHLSLLSYIPHTNLMHANTYCYILACIAIHANKYWCVVACIAIDAHIFSSLLWYVLWYVLCLYWLILILNTYNMNQIHANTSGMYWIHTC